MVEQIKKRDGSVVPFDAQKIAFALRRALEETQERSTVGPNSDDAAYVTQRVLRALYRVAKQVGNFIPTVEGVQDEVERQLMQADFPRTARAYILYREQRNEARKEAGTVPAEVQKLVDESKTYFRNPLAEFVYYRTYSRWMPEQERRETWVETVERYMFFMREKIGDGALGSEEWSRIEQAIRRMEVMPSMRLMWSAGAACRSTNVCAYNCAYIAPSCFQDFAEVLYVLTCGTGVGFSVESRNVQELPIVARQRRATPDRFVVPDSKEGWADALALGMERWFAGHDLAFDFSEIRPEGARLRTMGGRASGPQPLIDLLAFARSMVLRNQGRRLTSLDVHDLLCKIGEAIVVGGVRRSAMISLSDLDDEDVRRSKEGHFYIANSQRSLANNSAVYSQKPSSEEFLDEWVSLVKSRSGERGIFNRGDLLKQVPERRAERWREMGEVEGESIVGQIGCNPCGEINLLSKQFCNLTEVVCRDADTLGTLKAKVHLATILGTYQSTLTNFPYLSPAWKENCERERLLGISLTGQWDCPEVRDRDTLRILRGVAVEINARYAARWNIEQSTAVTCVKPSGTVSQLVDAASGMHPRYAPYYIRRVRINATDPLFRMLRDQRLPYHPEVGQTHASANTFVFEFPVKASGAAPKLSALEQLEHWYMVKAFFTEHNPSVTISIAPDEWVEVAGWLWKHWEQLGGLAFLPREDMVYQLAPFEEITAEQYEELAKRFTGINYAKILHYERDDETSGARELACAGNACEI